ncbi:MAG TPA: hypothetical protein VGO60_07325 [Iamia sp.]|jgi:hypothetical protein|nr:hypothetical protein [Iamia sp.]
MTAATTGSILTCTNDDCPCRIEVQVPCPHGETYSCACGHPFVSASDTDDGSIPPTPGA